MAVTLSGCCCKGQQSAYPTDTIPTAKGGELAITFFAHSSLALCYEGKRIYVDPVSGNADYASLPKADLILVTHEHYDHLDAEAIGAISTPATRIVANAASVAQLGRGETMRNGDRMDVGGYVHIEAVPAYNITPGHTDFHPHNGRDNGYILTLGGTRVYIAGDSENTPEMMSLRDIDIAFLPVNQPYTMTVEQAAEAVRAIRPRIFYPYHYGQVEQPTDIEALVQAVRDVTQVRVRPME